MIEETTTPRTTFGELAGNAIRYWEPRRLIYNLGLTAVVLTHCAASWPYSKALLNRDYILGLFMLAVLANVAYCAAYAVDLFVQSAGPTSVWLRWRWLLLLIGTAFAAVLAHFFMLGIFGFH